jgi:hypothetical protein
MGDDAAGMAGELGEEAIFLRRQAHLFAGLRHPPRRQIDLDIAGNHHRHLGPGRQPMAERGADPRQHLLGVERLGDIIVGAEIERGDLVLGLVARRDDDQSRARRLDQRHQLQPVAIGQPEIEQHRVRLVDLQRRQRLARGLGLDGSIAGAGDRGAEQPPDRALVIDDQDFRLKAHAPRLPLPGPFRGTGS